MKFPRFSVFQLLLLMLVFCFLAAAVNHVVSSQYEVSPFIFLLMLLASPVVLVVVVSVMRQLTRRGK